MAEIVLRLNKKKDGITFVVKEDGKELVITDPETGKEVRPKIEPGKGLVISTDGKLQFEAVALPPWAQISFRRFTPPQKPEGIELFATQYPFGD